MSGTEEKYVYYYYTPTIAGAIIFIALFGISTLWHGFQLLRTRTWSFIPFFIGGIFEVIGYIARCFSHSDNEALSPFIAQSILLLVAPALFAASIYMVLGRLIALLDAEKHSIIRLRWLTKIFVAGDVFSFFLQGGGGGMMAKAGSQDLGQTLILAGLFVQIVFFGFFMIASIIFHCRINQDPTGASLSLSNSAPSLRTSWLGLMYALYGSSAAILIRSIFRIVEYVQGHEGYLLKHEVYLYLFDAVLMAVAMFIFNWIYPATVLQRKATRRGRNYQCDDESTEMVA